MIDVVFVILLFFIVQASDIQVENAHVTKLPGTVESTTETVLPDEIAVRDRGRRPGLSQRRSARSPTSTPKNLPEFAGSLNSLREASDASKSKVLVTIYANELARYERVIDVLDALSRAKITDVTFQAGSPE